MPVTVLGDIDLRRPNGRGVVEANEPNAGYKKIWAPGYNSKVILA